MSTIGAAQSDTLLSNINEMKPKFAKIAAGSSGDNEVVAAVANKKIRVIALHFVVAGVVTVIWKSGSTAISGDENFAQNSGMHLAEVRFGHFETAAGEALNINLSGNVTVGGTITYVEVPTDR